MVVASVLACTCLGWPLHLRAQSGADADLGAIRQQMEEASFREAATGLEGYLARTDLDAAQRNAGLELDAMLSLARRDETRASSVLTELYARDPGHRLEDPDASPVVVSAFARARESATQRAVSVETDAGGALARHEAPTIEVRLTGGADIVQEIGVSYRLQGAERFSVLVLAPESSGVASATLPIGSDPGAQTIELFVEARAPSGHVLASAGSASEPRRIVIPAASAASGPVTSAGGSVGEPTDGGGGDVAGEWWLWTLVGVAVVGAGVGIGLGVGLQPERPVGTLGSATLPLVRF